MAVADCRDSVHLRRRPGSPFGMGRAEGRGADPGGAPAGRQAKGRCDFPGSGPRGGRAEGHARPREGHSPHWPCGASPGDRWGQWPQGPPEGVGSAGDVRQWRTAGRRTSMGVAVGNGSPGRAALAGRCVARHQECRGDAEGRGLRSTQSERCESRFFAGHGQPDRPPQWQ